MSDVGEGDGNVAHDQKDICERLALLLDDISFGIRGFEPLRVILRSEAVRFQRGVSKKTPLGEQATFGRMLNNLGIALNDDGRPDESCVADEDAILIRRELYRIRPSASRSDLALSLYNYGIHLGMCKRYKEACVADAEATGLYKILFERDSDEYCTLFAYCLH